MNLTRSSMRRDRQDDSRTARKRLEIFVNNILCNCAVKKWKSYAEHPVKLFGWLMSYNQLPIQGDGSGLEEVTTTGRRPGFMWRVAWMQDRMTSCTGWLSLRNHETKPWKVQSTLRSLSGPASSKKKQRMRQMFHRSVISNTFFQVPGCHGSRESTRSRHTDCIVHLCSWGSAGLWELHSCHQRHKRLQAQQQTNYQGNIPNRTLLWDQIKVRTDAGASAQVCCGFSGPTPPTEKNSDRLG